MKVLGYLYTPNNLMQFNLIQVNFPFYSHKILENLSFPDVFKGDENRTLAWNG